MYHPISCSPRAPGTLTPDPASTTFLARFRSFWLLPAGHLLIDSVVLGLWLLHIREIGREMKAHRVALQAPTHVAMLEEASGPYFDIIDVDPPPEFTFLASGNIPATVISLRARPGPVWSDLWWYLIYEVASFVIWFGIGLSVAAKRGWLANAMRRYLVLRCPFAALVTVPWVATLGAAVEVPLWIALALCVFARCIKWSGRASLGIKR